MKPIFCVVLFLFSINISAQEICNNGIDDDGDLLIDLNDIADCSCGLGTPPSVVSLIPNPSFEQRTCCPSGLDEFCVTSWSASATPDYFNTCHYAPIAITNAGLTNYPDGSGCVGTVFTSDYKEYVTSCLNTPMLAGNAYTLKFNTACLLADSYLHIAVCGPNNTYGPVDLTIYGKANCSNLTSVTGATNTCISIADTSWKVLGSVSYTPSLAWSLVAITFTPSININAIAFGSPCNLPATYPAYIESSFSCMPYFLFDNLRLNTSANTSLIDITSTGHYCTNNLVLKSQLVSSVSSGATLQWFRNGVALVGQTSSTYSVPAGFTGNYQMMINNGSFCALSSTFSVTAATPTIAAYSPTICNYSSYTLLATSPVITTYTWSNGATTNTTSVSPNTTTIYTVSGTYGSCISQATPTVTVIYGTSNPLTITASTLLTCPGGTVGLMTQNGGGSNYWSDGGHGYIFGGTQTQSVVIKPYSTIAYSVTSIYQNPLADDCLSGAVITISVIPTSVSVSPNNIKICPGRSITLTATGVNSYTWSNGVNTNTNTVTPVVNTTYTVTGTSGACTVSATAFIRADSTINVYVGYNDYSCAASTNTLYGYGATSYTWSTGAIGNQVVVSPTVATTYSVTGASGYCFSQATVTVNVIDPTLFPVSANTLICSGQGVAMTATVPSEFANYYKTVDGPSSSAIWNSFFSTYNITPTVTSTYTVTTHIQNALCTPVSVITISVVPVPTVSVSPVSGNICAGETITFVATGSGNYTWSNNSSGNSITVSPVSYTAYTVSSSNGVCSSSATCSVSVKQLPVLSFSEVPVLCSTSELVILFATPAGGIFSGIGVVQNSTFDPFISGIGTFSVSYNYTDANGCSNTINNTIIVSSCTGQIELASSDFLIYPNPTNSLLFITANQLFGSVKITNSIGQVVSIYKNIPKEISVLDFADGIYIIQLFDKSGMTLKTEKFIKN